MSDDARAFSEGYTAGFRDGRGTLKDPTAPAAGGEEGQAEKPLTLADVKKMTHDDINARWDEVLPLLEATHHVK